MKLPETPEVDNVNDGLIYKYLNAELIFDVGTGNEQKGCIVKRAKETSGEPIGAHMSIHSSTFVSMWPGSPMNHPKTTTQMSSPSACMHKLIL